MDISADIREFLISRRARRTPAEAGLPDFGGRRRVAGLRREEVALLAGMSVEYYVRLERGNAKGVSESVLDGISRALNLDAAERSHLDDLARAANDGAHTRRRDRPARPEQVGASTRQLLDAMRDVPAIVQNARLDLLATNELGRAVFSEMSRQPQRPANFARFVFLEPRALDFYRDWDDAAAQTVALLRSAAGRSPHDRALSDLVGEISVRDETFRTLWASHDVRQHSTGIKRISHPVVGDLDLSYEAMSLTSGLQLVAYSAPPASATTDALSVLAAWSATQKTPESTTDSERAEAPRP
jgi:transcriptional regulator with XRE-family HTH domain